MEDLQFRTRAERDFADITLDRPVTEILSRGSKLRQRRQRLTTLGVLTIASVAATIAVQTTARHSPAFAAWTSRAQATDAKTAAAIDSSCRRDAIPSSLPRRVLDRRGDFALAVYTDGQSVAVCHRFRGNAQPFFTQGGSNGPGAVTRASSVTPGHPVALEGSEATVLVHEGSAVSAFGWVGPDVAKVVITSGNYTTTATLTDGLFSGWWPGDSNGNLTTVSCTAYNAKGEVVGHDTLAAG